MEAQRVVMLRATPDDANDESKVARVKIFDENLYTVESLKLCQGREESKKNQKRHATTGLYQRESRSSNPRVRIWHAVVSVDDIVLPLHRFHIVFFFATTLRPHCIREAERTKPFHVFSFLDGSCLFAHAALPVCPLASSRTCDSRTVFLSECHASALGILRRGFDVSR